VNRATDDSVNYSTTMAEGLARKKRIRAEHKASATQTLTKVEEALVAAAERTEEFDASKLSQLKLSLQEKLEVLRQLDAEILELTDKEGLVDEIEQADLFKEGIYIALVRIEKATAIAATPIAPPTPRASTETPTEPIERRVKLPKLSLKSFNGDITTWTTFWDSYESAIHSNTSLSDIDKFNYLKSLLERSAHRTIAGLTLTSANYHEAVAILKKRFGSRQQIISRHMELLLNLEAVTSQHNIKGLQRLYDTVETHVRSLKNLGVASESYGSLLTSVLLNKLP